MVREYLEWMRSTLEVGTPFAESCDDGEHFFVVDLVVELGRRELAGIERDRMQHAVGGGLRDDGRNGEVGRISQRLKVGRDENGREQELW